MHNFFAAPQGLSSSSHCAGTCSYSPRLHTLGAMVTARAALAVAGATCIAAILVSRRQRSSRRRGAVLAGTWKFSNIALEAAARHMESGATLLDSVEVGIRALEADTAVKAVAQVAPRLIKVRRSIMVLVAYLVFDRIARELLHST